MATPDRRVPQRRGASVLGRQHGVGDGSRGACDVCVECDVTSVGAAGSCDTFIGRADAAAQLALAPIVLDADAQASHQAWWAQHRACAAHHTALTCGSCAARIART